MTTQAQPGGLFRHQFGLFRVVWVVTTQAIRHGCMHELAGHDLLELVVASQAKGIANLGNWTGILRVVALVAKVAFA